MSELPYRPNAWWPSKLEDYRKCLQYGKLKHIDRAVPQDGSLDTEFGTAMHLAVNDMLCGGNGQDIFDMCFRLVKENTELKRFKYGWEALNAMAPVFLRKFKRLHAARFKPLSMEVRLFGNLDGTPIEGTPDFLGHYEDIPSIVDFKTSGSSYLRQMLIVQHQLPFYTELSKQKLGFTPTQKVLYVFVKDLKDPSIQVLKSPLTDIILNDTIVNVKSEIKLYENLAEHPKNFSACVRGPIVCAAFSLCHGSSKPDGE